MNCFSVIKDKLDFVLDYSRVFELFDFLDGKACVKYRYSELAVGDIILWRKNIVPRKGDSGHIAIITELMEDGWIRVYDYSKQPHSNESCIRPGTGIGTMKLILDGDEINGFIWSKENKKTKRTKVLGISPQDLKNLF